MPNPEEYMQLLLRQIMDQQGTPSMAEGNPLMGAGETAPTPSPLGPGDMQQGTPAPSPFDKYEQSVMDKAMNTSPESIYQDKVKEYYQSLGIKNPNSFRGKMAARLHEAGLSAQANANRPPGYTNLYNDYKSAEDRLRDSAQKEYDKSGPLMKTQATELARTAREREMTAGREKIAAGAQAETRRRTESQERIAQGAQRIKELQVMADKGNKDAMAALNNERRLGMEQERKALENDPLFKSYSPKLKDALAFQRYQDKYGDTRATQLLGSVDDLSNAEAPPSIVKAMMNQSDEGFKKSLGRYGDIRTADRNSKFPPGSNSGANNPFKLLPAMGPDGQQTYQFQGDVTRDLLNQGRGQGLGQPQGIPQTNIPGVQPTLPQNGAPDVPRASATDPSKDAATYKPPRALPPWNANEGKLLQSLVTSGGYSRMAAASVISAIQTGQDKDMTGFANNNPVSNYLRETFGTKGFDETMMKLASQTSIGLHTLAVRGGGRISDQAITEMTKTLARPTASANSLMRVYATHAIIVELVKASKQGDFDASEITPGFITYMNNQVDKMGKQAQATRGMPQTEVHIPSGMELLQQYRQIKTTTPGVDKATPAKKKTVDEMWEENKRMQQGR